MKKRMMLIINPMAGRSGYKTGFGEVMNILDSGGYLTTVYFTQGRGDATVFAAQHAAEYDTVACIGGDGTLSEVVSGLMQVPNPPPLGYIPMGTTNDVASTLGLPKNATDAALRIVTGTPTAFDVGSFGEQSFFTYVAAFGAFTAVSYETPQNEKQALGHLAYVLEAMGRLNAIDHYCAHVEYDGGTVDGDFIFGGVSNSTSVAGMVRLRKDLVSLGDGLFETLLIRRPKQFGDLSRIITGVLNQGLSIMGVDAAWVKTIKGLVVIAAVVMVALIVRLFVIGHRDQHAAEERLLAQDPSQEDNIRLNHLQTRVLYGFLVFMLVLYLAVAAYGALAG